MNQPPNTQNGYGFNTRFRSTQGYINQQNSLPVPYGYNLTNMVNH